MRLWVRPGVWLSPGFSRTVAGAPDVSQSRRSSSFGPRVRGGMHCSIAGLEMHYSYSMPGSVQKCIAAICSTGIVESALATSSEKVY
jgi:hypothetical protein